MCSSDLVKPEVVGSSPIHPAIESPGHRPIAGGLFAMWVNCGSTVGQYVGQPQRVVGLFSCGNRQNGVWSANELQLEILAAIRAHHSQFEPSWHGFERLRHRFGAWRVMRAMWALGFYKTPVQLPPLITRIGLKRLSKPQNPCSEGSHNENGYDRL